MFPPSDAMHSTLSPTQNLFFCVGDSVECMATDGGNIELKVLDMKDEEGNRMESCPHPKQRFKVKFDVLPAAGNVLRKKEAT